MEAVPGDDAIYLEQMELGPMQNFVYLIGDPQARECVVVDPAWEIDTIVETAQARGMTITGALVTHTHQDHVGGSLESWGMPGRIPGVEDLLERVRRGCMSTRRSASSSRASAPTSCRWTTTR